MARQVLNTNDEVLIPINGGYLLVTAKGTLTEYPGLFVDFIKDANEKASFSIPVVTVETVAPDDDGTIHVDVPCGVFHDDPYDTTAATNGDWELGYRVDRRENEDEA